MMDSTTLNLMEMMFDQKEDNEVSEDHSAPTSVQNNGDIGISNDELDYMDIDIDNFQVPMSPKVKESYSEEQDDLKEELELFYDEQNNGISDYEDRPQVRANEEHTKQLKKSQVTLSFQEHFEKKVKNERPSQPILKRFLEKGREVDDCGLNPIHRACIDYPNNAKLIGMMLRKLPSCVEFQAKKVEGSDCAMKKDTKRFISGMYPIHIAILNYASMDVIKLLVRANPHVLSRPDITGMVPLSLAFRVRDKSADMEHFNNMLVFLLASNPDAAKVADNRQNTPLHYACMTLIHPGGLKQQQQIRQDNQQMNEINTNEAASTIQKQIRFTSQSRVSTKRKPGHISFEIISKLLEANPHAATHQNFDGNTPLDLAQVSGNLDDQSIALLQKVAYQHEEVDEAPDV